MRFECRPRGRHSASGCRATPIQGAALPLRHNGFQMNKSLLAAILAFALATPVLGSGTTMTPQGIIFPDGSTQTSAAGSGGLPSGTAIVTSINDPATTGRINLNRLSSSLVQFNPASEQVSAGSTNGPGAMINLRGNSTSAAGTPYAAWFRLFQNGSMVVTGNLGIGVPVMEGPGYRTSWDSYKAAFRSGYAPTDEWNDANVGFMSWAGGDATIASGVYSFAFGNFARAHGTGSTAFGNANRVHGTYGFTAGSLNRVCDSYGAALGYKAISGGPLVSGDCDPETVNVRGLGAIALGYNVTADQDYTIALGKFASTNGFSGSLVWSDGSAFSAAATFTSSANNEAAFRASGGFRFRTNASGSTGCNLAAGSGVFTCASSRSTKENLARVDGESVLVTLRSVPVNSWNYIAEGAGVRHVGPMAEEFHAAFGLGTGNTTIGVQDLTGITLAAVKALEERTVELRQKSLELEQKSEEVDALRAQLLSLEERLTRLEKNR